MPEITNVVNTLEERRPYIALKQKVKGETFLACDNTSIAGAMSQRA